MHTEALSCLQTALSAKPLCNNTSSSSTDFVLLQVPISIESMIFVAEPYYNEPGYKISRNISHSKPAWSLSTMLFDLSLSGAGADRHTEHDVYGLL